MSKTVAHSKIDHLIEHSIKIYPEMRVYFPDSEQSEIILYRSDILEHSGCYAINNSTVAFIFQCNLYSTPYTREVISILKEEGFVENYFWVPFSNCECPFDEKLKWKHLVAKAAETRKLDFIQDCCAYSDKKGFGILDSTILKNVLIIPKTGISIRHFNLNYETIIYPAISSNFIDSIAIDKIGLYQTNNGVVVFVYRDGSTYITKGYKIVSFLENAGYKRGSLFVPFSNGEEIIDPNFLTQWVNIKEF